LFGKRSKVLGGHNEINAAVDQEAVDVQAEHEINILDLVDDHDRSLPEGMTLQIEENEKEGVNIMSNPTPLPPNVFNVMPPSRPSKQLKFPGHESQHHSSAPPQLTSAQPPQDYETDMLDLTDFIGDHDTFLPEDVTLQMEENERQDVNIISEYAWQGKPNIDAIIAEEVATSQGSIIVASGGPTPLCMRVNKSIAAMIDPSRVRRGDMRGSITHISEEYKY